jgi:LytS/YehU family sensor histidine kinase
MFVRLHDNITFLSNYIELESLRNRDQLEFTITNRVPAEENPLLPNMIIQPHVENAIKHGISNLENKMGKLCIEFVKNGVNLVCTITDNGIGRVASEKLNRKNKLHVSRGTKLTDEKSLFLKQYNNYHCEIEVIDLYDNKSEALGTKVIITMPLDHERRNS